jgi:hypothetical protein
VFKLSPSQVLGIIIYLRVHASYIVCWFISLNAIFSINGYE